MSTKSAKQRHWHMSRVHRLYKHDDPNLGGICVYCGVRASSVDHVPPVSLAADMKIEELIAFGPKLFPACQHCNSILGESWELLLVDRRDIIAQYLEIKKKRLLARGKEIYEKKLPIFNNFREMTCLQVYERWLFATLTTNEATPEPEPEQEYTRKNFSKTLEKTELSTQQWFSSWGLPTELSIDLLTMDNFKLTGQRNLTTTQIKRLQIAQKYLNIQGPFGWAGSMEKYKLLVDTIVSRDALDEFYADIDRIAPFFEIKLAMEASTKETEKNNCSGDINEKNKNQKSAALSFSRYFPEGLASDASALVLKARGGSGERYTLLLRTTKSWLPWHNYKSEFVAGAAWSEVRLDISGFNRCVDILPKYIDPKDVRSITLAADGANVYIGGVQVE